MIDFAIWARNPVLNSSPLYGEMDKRKKHFSALLVLDLKPFPNAGCWLVVCQSMVPLGGTPTCCVSIVCEIGFPVLRQPDEPFTFFEDQDHREFYDFSSLFVAFAELLFLLIKASVAI